MREIKFRAFNKEQKKFMYSEEGSGGWWGDCIVDCPNDYEPIQQFTGLLDKNGKEIYEGDIMKGLSWKEPYALKTSTEILGEVKWSEFNHGWVIHSKLPKGFRTFLTFSRSEVIGNIWEHPNLLESK